MQDSLLRDLNLGFQASPRMQYSPLRSQFSVSTLPKLHVLSFKISIFGFKPPQACSTLFQDFNLGFQASPSMQYSLLRSQFRVSTLPKHAVLTFKISIYGLMKKKKNQRGDPYSSLRFLCRHICGLFGSCGFACSRSRFALLPQLVGFKKWCSSSSCACFLS